MDLLCVSVFCFVLFGCNLMLPIYIIVFVIFFFLSFGRAKGRVMVRNNDFDKSISYFCFVFLFFPITITAEKKKKDRKKLVQQYICFIRHVNTCFARVFVMLFILECSDVVAFYFVVLCMKFN